MYLEQDYRETMTTHIFRISIIDDYEDIECYREIEVPVGHSLNSFAEGIVTAFNFDFDHAFGFYGDLTRRYLRSDIRYELFADMNDADSYSDLSGEAKGLSVKRAKVGKVFTEPGQKMQFVFDYGDEWRFLVELIGSGVRKKGRRYPLVHKEFGEAPEQYPDWDDEDYDDDD